MLHLHEVRSAKNRKCLGFDRPFPPKDALGVIRRQGIEQREPAAEVQRRLTEVMEVEILFCGQSNYLILGRTKA